MASPRTDEALVKAVRAVEEALRKGYKPKGVSVKVGEFGAIRIAAQHSGISRTTFQYILDEAERKGLGPDWSIYKPSDQSSVEIPPNDIDSRVAARKGDLGYAPVLPGYEIAQISTNEDGKSWVKQKPEAGPEFEVPDGHVVKGVSALVGADGRTLASWVKTKEGVPDPVSLAREFEAAFCDFKPAAKPKPAPVVDYKDQIAVLPWSDPHFGLMCWRREAREDWDLKTAVATYQRVFAGIVERTPRTHKAILVVGGDTLHADDNSNQTPHSRHPLQVDGRHQKVFLSAGETIVEIAGWMLDHHAEVEIIVIAGNHDPTSAFPLACFLSAWFRNEPRMAVDLSPNIHRFRQFGRVGLGFTHGHTIKKSALHTLFAEAAPKIWGETQYRHFHTFHVHHDSAQDKGGCKVESHGVLIPPDAYAWGAGYTAAQRHQKSIVYHAERGWRETIVEAV